MLGRVWRKGGTSTPLVGVWLSAATVEGSMDVCLKAKNRAIIIQHCLSWVYYQKKMKTLIQKDTHAQCHAALFTVAKRWKQPKCPSTDEWIQKMCIVIVCVCIYICIFSSVCAHMGAHTHTHTEILLSHKNIWNNDFCSNMSRPRIIILSKVSQTNINNR